MRNRPRADKEIAQDLLNLGSISHARLRAASAVDTYLSARVPRATNTHRLSNQIIDSLVQRFGTLQQVLRAPKDDLVEVDGVGEVLAERIRVSLSLLRNQLIIDERR